MQSEFKIVDAMSDQMGSEAQRISTAPLPQLPATVDVSAAEDAGELCKMLQTAGGDVFALIERHRKADNATDRRGLVRAIFAFTESMLFAMKQSALGFAESANFVPADYALLREETYELTDKGEPCVRKAKLTLKSNFKYSFAVFAKATRSDFALDLGDVGWQQFMNSIKVRDRLMHPKQVADLNVSDDEVKEAVSAYMWFYCTFSIALAQTVATMNRHLKAAGKWTVEDELQIARLVDRCEKSASRSPDSVEV